MTRGERLVSVLIFLVFGMPSVLDAGLASICEEKHTSKNTQGKDDESDLVFGSLEEETNDHSNEKHQLSLTNTVDSPCDSLLSIARSDQESTLTHEEKQRSREKIAEQFIKMANSRAKHRQSKPGSSGHWKNAAKKAGDIVDPW